MTIKLTKKQMKELKNSSTFIATEKEIKEYDVGYVGNNYYYANSFGCRVRVQECYAKGCFGAIIKVLCVKQDYEGIFRN